MSQDWKPCRFIDYEKKLGDPRYGVVFDQFQTTSSVLEDMGYMGGGYTWHGIIESMIRTRYPHYSKDISYDPESSLFCANSSNLDALQCVADCIRRALSDTAVLEEAIRNANPKIIE